MQNRTEHFLERRKTMNTIMEDISKWPLEKREEYIKKSLKKGWEDRLIWRIQKRFQRCFNGLNYITVIPQ